MFLFFPSTRVFSFSTDVVWTLSINSLAPAIFAKILKMIFSNAISDAYVIFVLSQIALWSVVVIPSQNWFKQWFGAVRLQAIAWANVYPNKCLHVVSLVRNE